MSGVRWRFVRSISPENLRKTFQKYSLCNVLMFEFTFIEVYFFYNKVILVKNFPEISEFCFVNLIKKSFL